MPFSPEPNMDPSGPPRDGAGAMVRELAETALLAVILFLLLRVAVQNFRIEGHSMEPNLHDGQFLIVDKVTYRLREPQRGEVVIFEAPPSPQKDFIKRVIGLPGEKVQVKEGLIYINDRPWSEPYISYPGGGSWGPSWVGPDEYFVLGDNRPSSNDSRQWGMLPEADIIGRAWLSYWPPGQWGLVSNGTYAAPP